MSAPTRDLARWIASLRYEDVPRPAREVARAALLDTLGCGVYGHSTPWAAVVRRWAGGAVAAEASVWGEASRSARAADAALANGVAAHAFELDDYHNVKIHPGAAVIPAAVALGEKHDVSGRALLTAVVAGYETMIRASLALDPVVARGRGWHLTGVCGPLGAAAAAATLLGLDAERSAWALGLAGTQGAGLFAFNADGSMSKRLHPGRAAHAGVLAAELAQAGFTGPTQLFEADDGGFLAAYSDAPRPERLTAGLGASYLMEQTSFKPYSCCGSLHAYVDAALDLRAKLGTIDAAARVRAGIARVVDLQCGFDYSPSTVMHAQMSLRYCVAVALLEGAALPPQFAPEKLADPTIHALARRLEIVPDPELDRVYPEHFAAWLAVDGAHGSVRVDVLDPTGSPARPMGRDALAAKLRGLLAGTRVASMERAIADLEAAGACRLVSLLAVG